MINKQELRVAAVLAAIFALRMLGLCMLLPIFAIEALAYTAATPQLIGIAVGGYGLAQALLQLPFGWLSDRFGRKTLIVLGLAIIMFGSLIGAMATSIYGLIIGRILQGCGSIGSVVLVTLTENVREQVRASAMAILGATIGLSFAIALVLGPWVNQGVGLPGVFAVIACLALLCIVLVFVLPKSAPMSRVRTVEPTKLRLKGLKLPLAEVNFGVFVIHANLAALFLILPGILQQHGIIAEKVWQFYAIAICSAMLVAWRLIAVGERTQKLPKLQSIAILCLLLAEVILYTLHGWLYIAGSLLVFFSAFCVLEASLPALVTKHATAEKRGAAMGLYSCLQFLGIFVGGVVGGWLQSLAGATAVISFCIGLVLSWLIFNMLSMKSQRGSLGAKSSLYSEG